MIEQKEAELKKDLENANQAAEEMKTVNDPVGLVP